MIVATFSPVAVGMSGAVYGVIALGLGIEFWRRCWRVWKSEEEQEKTAKPLFLFPSSICSRFSLPCYSIGYCPSPCCDSRQGLIGVEVQHGAYPERLVACICVWWVK